jgi:hypothetical protein
MVPGVTTPQRFAYFTIINPDFGSWGDREVPQFSPDRAHPFSYMPLELGSNLTKIDALSLC